MPAPPLQQRRCWVGSGNSDATYKPCESTNEIDRELDLRIRVAPSTESARVVDVAEVNGTGPARRGLEIVALVISEHGVTRPRHGHVVDIPAQVNFLHVLVADADVRGRDGRGEEDDEGQDHHGQQSEWRAHVGVSR